MTVLVLDNPELIANAAIAAGFTTATFGAGARRPHRMKFHYGFNKHSLDSDDIAFLKQHAAYLKDHPSVTVRIHGHSDNFGSEDYNRFLSRLRANAVARILMQEGVQESRILMAHWGSARPLARPEDRAANRRVELEYLTMDVARAL
ncbi:OmpA family protein [Marinobacter sp.]|uniref:OmpA family protein n=1 Tax=Marinobacter sp. TaxID=50741 RepID=UPI00356276FB